MTLLAEDLLLLLIDDETGKPVLDSTRLDRALAGGVLLDLALAGRISPALHGEPVKRGSLVIRDARPTDDTTLDEALGRLAGKPLGAPRAVEKLVKGLRANLLGRIVNAGFVREERGRILGVFPKTRWPAVRPEHEAGIRRALSEVLIDGRQPNPRVAALVSLLTAVDAVPKVIPTNDRRALIRRARQVAEGEWVGAAVRKAVDAVNAGMVAATTAATTTAGG